MPAPGPSLAPPGPRLAGTPPTLEEMGAVLPAPPPRMVVRPGGAHRRWTLRRFDLVSVARFSFAFYLTALAVSLLVGVVLWGLASAAGLIGSLEGFIKSLFALSSFHLHPGRILLGAALVGAALTVIGTVCNVVGAAVYNLIAGMVGGVRVVVSEGAAPGGPRPSGGPGNPSRPII